MQVTQPTTIESNVAALTQRVSTLENKADHNEKTHSKFYDRLAVLEKGTELSDTLGDVKHQQIMESIERLGKQQSESNEAIHLKINAFIELSDARHKEHGRRLSDLEDAENRKILAAAQKREEEKRANRKHIASTAIAVVVTFLVTLLLNNVFDIILDKIFV